MSNGLYQKDHYVELSPRTGWQTAAFSRAREEAYSSFLASAKRHYEAQGIKWADKGERASQREEAVRQSEKARGMRWRALCDKEILEQLDMLVRQKNGGAEKLAVTPSVYYVLKAELKLVKDSSVLYASAATVARLANVCPDTVYKTNALLERLGVLRRQKSGGICTDKSSKDFGKTKANEYKFSHQALRRALGIECRYQSRHEVPEREGVDRANIFYAAMAAMMHAQQQKALQGFCGRGASWHPYSNGFGYTRNTPRGCGKPYETYYSGLIQVYKCAAPDLESALLLVRTKKEHQQERIPYFKEDKPSRIPIPDQSTKRQSRSLACQTTGSFDDPTEGSLNVEYRSPNKKYNDPHSGAPRRTMKK